MLDESSTWLRLFPKTMEGVPLEVMYVLCLAKHLEHHKFSTNASYSLIYLSPASVPFVLVSFRNSIYLYVESLLTVFQGPNIYILCLMWFNLYSKHKPWSCAFPVSSTHFVIQPSCHPTVC